MAHRCSGDPVSLRAGPLGVVGGVAVRDYLTLDSLVRAACPLERRGEVLGQLGAEHDPVTRPGVLEREPVAVEELADEAVATRLAVGGIAHDRVADRGEVGADLMRAARLEPGADQGIVHEELVHLEMGERLALGAAGDSHPGRITVAAADRRVDHSAPRAQATLYEGEVLALALAG